MSIARGRDERTKQNGTEPQRRRIRTIIIITSDLVLFTFCRSVSLCHSVADIVLRPYIFYYFFHCWYRSRGQSGPRGPGDLDNGN